MSKKILVTELMNVLGVSKTNANAFADHMDAKYSISLSPVPTVDDVLDAPVGSDSITEEDDVNFGQEYEQGEFIKELSQAADQDSVLN